MKKLSTTEEVNLLYDAINKHIDEYINEWNIDPLNLHKYMLKGNRIENFLKKHKLDEIQNSKVVLLDVIEDRSHMINDNIIKFENFNKIKENLSIGPSTINHEKVLADMYKTSIGHIETINSTDHEYEVRDFGKNIDVIIYSLEDMNSFKKSLFSLIKSSIKSSKITIKNLKIKGSDVDVNFTLDANKQDLFNEKALNASIEESLNDKYVLSFVNNYISFNDRKFNYKGKFKSHYIWEKIDKTQ